MSEGTNEVYDVAVIGAGPIGMAATFYVATRGLKPVLIDVLDSLGGQCSTLYPEKMIYDIASQTGCTGLHLIEQLTEQLRQVPYDLKLNTTVKELQRNDDIWFLNTTEGTSIKAKVIIVAIGKGAFEPRKLWYSRNHSWVR